MIRIWNIFKVVIQSSFSFIQPSTPFDFSTVSPLFFLLLQFIFHLSSGWEFGLIHLDYLYTLLVLWDIFQFDQYRLREIDIYDSPTYSLTRLGRREADDSWIDFLN